MTNGLGNFIATRLLGMHGRDSRGYFTYAFEERRTAYRYADDLYDNTIYGSDTECTWRKEMFKRVAGRPRRNRQELLPHINPIAGIVDCYRNCVSGRLGVDLKPERKGQELPSPLLDSLRIVWRDSRLDLATEPMQYFGANYGASFLRIYADRETGRVRVVPLHPGNVIDIETNESGAIVEALLEYDVMVGPLGEDRDTKTFRERLSKDQFSRWEKGKEDTTRVSLPNALGVCPLVLIKHADKGREYDQRGAWGLNAWNGSDDIVHLVNIRMSQLGLSIDKTLWAKWFVAAAGDAPSQIDLSGDKIVLTKLNQGDPTPQIKAIVEPINAQAALEQVDRIMTSLIARQPEMVLDHLESLSGQSGETIRKLLTRVTTRIVDARAKYETGLIDALKQAISWRITLGLDPSLGGPTRDVADTLYRSGELDFEFARRPALPPTPDEIIVDAKARYADVREGLSAAAAGSGVLSVEDQLKAAGYSDQDAATKAAAKNNETQEAEARQAAAAAARRPAS